MIISFQKRVRVIAGVTICAILVSLFLPLLSIKNNVARAQFIDPANLVVNTITSTNTTLQSGGIAPKNFLDALVWIVAKMTVQSITRSMVNWINSGFNGSPAFVTDLRENLSYLGDSIAEDFLNRLDNQTMRATGFSIRTPFQDQINQKLRKEYFRTTSSYGLDYTLNQYSKDPKAFLQGNFSQGGFNTFFPASQNDANNPAGAYRRSMDQLWAQIDAGTQQRKAEIEQGRGFLPWRGSCKQNTTTGGATNFSRSEKCPFDKIRTPGSVIENQLSQTLGSGVRQLELADSINEIVGALLGQLVNQVLGAGGLIGTSQPSQGGGQSYLDQATNTNVYNDQLVSLSGGFQQNLVGERKKVEEYQSNWNTIRSAAQIAQNSCGIRPEIQSVFMRADAAQEKARNALAKITELDIKVAVTAKAPTTDAGLSNAIATTVTDFNSFLNSKVVPSTEDYADAARQSQETDGQATITVNGVKQNTTSAETSLRTQMNRLASNCGR